MIIVKTKNGDRFINDKAVTEVQHDREKAVVNCWGANGYFSHHNDVEGVIYTNDAQPTSWKDEGSEIQRLMKSLDEQRELVNKMRDEYLKIEQERDELKERVAQLEPKPAADYENDKLMVVYEEIDRMEIAEREQQKREHPNWRSVQKKGNGVRFLNIAKANDIETVGQLLKVGRVHFEQLRNMGPYCAAKVSEALKNLYGIETW